MQTIIRIQFSKNIKEIYQYGINHSKLYKGTFVGDLNKGTFDFETNLGKFKGNYVVIKQMIIFTFSKKPFFIPKIVIENFLNMHIN